MTPIPGSHLVLVGLPGAGKTTVGRLLAERLGMPFIDFDEEIERREERSVAEIFASQGEAAFREMENRLTRELVNAEPAVLAPGGGWMANSANVALLRPPARIIHLRVGVEEALRRLGTSTDARPLLRGGKARESLSELAEQRRPVYERADAEVETQVIAVPAVVDLLVRIAAGWGWLENKGKVGTK